VLQPRFEVCDAPFAAGCTLADNLLNNSDTHSLDMKGSSSIIADTVYLRTSTVCNGGSCSGTYNVTTTKYSQPAVADP
jgi:hypothetical protein